MQRSYADVNAETIDRWVDGGWEWGKPIEHAEYAAALEGRWDVKLTPVRFVPHEWLGELRGKRLLGLACGGGQQMPVFAALGARCTVLDYSPRMLENERRVAEREGYDIEIVRADMSKRLPFDDGQFDLIFHPVSNCYVEDVRHVWRECFRVLKRGGALLAGFDTPILYAMNEAETQLTCTLPFNPLKNPEQARHLAQIDGGMQFSHTLEEQIGGQLEAGFALTALYDDLGGAGNLHEHRVPTYIATRSVKP